MSPHSQPQIDRRTFLRGVSGGALAISSVSCAGPQAAEPTNSGIRYRRLGRTNLMVSEIGLGCSPGGQRHKREDYMKEMPRVILRALELGINVVDSAPSYASESMIGETLKSWPRDQVILCTKSEKTKRDEIIKEFEGSLKKLGTDYLDVLHEHAHYRRPEGAYERLDFVEAAQKLRDDGKLRFFGVSGHDPAVNAEYVRTKLFDTVMIPHNYLTRGAEAELFPLAEDLDVGIFTIKPLTGRYQIWDQKPGADKRLDALVKEYSAQDYAEAAIRFALSNESLDCMMCGMERIRDIEANVAASRTLLARRDEAVLEQYAAVVGGDYCRLCERCVPCPNGVAIPDIQRFHMYFANYGHEGHARALYAALPEGCKPENCADCGQCEERCPHKLPIRAKLQAAREVLA